MTVSLTKSKPIDYQQEVPEDTQLYCIDLPGETVECYVHKPKLKVVLRKHRDVIFDLKLGSAKQYKVYATQADFYNARDKKLVEFERKQSVSFKDGERMHIWVSREFKGELILESGGKIMMRVDPKRWDGNRYDENPKTKPAPIIIGLNANAVPGQAAISPAEVKPLAMQSEQPPSQQKPIAQHIATHQPTSTYQSEECPVVCVVDGKLEGMPAHIAEYFKKGGGDKSGLADIDPNNIATRNWIWGQAAGSVAYVADNWEWLRASIDSKTHDGFRLVSAKAHKVGNKIRFYFSGYSKTNSVFRQGGYGPAHDRIMTIFSGVGSTASTFKATLKGIAGTFKANALISFIFGAGTAIAEWYEDIKKDGYDLAAALFTSLVKAIIVAALVVLTVAAIVGLLILAGATVSILVIGVITLAVGLGFNYVIEASDKALGKNLQGRNGDMGTNAWLAKHFEIWNQAIQSNWNYLIENFQKDYKEFTLERP